MSYTPTNWKAGDTVTSAKLNKIEQGIAMGGTVTYVHAQGTDDELVLDKTWEELYEAASQGMVILIQENDDSTSISISILSYILYADQIYAAGFLYAANVHECGIEVFYSTSPDELMTTSEPQSGGGVK